MVPKHIHNGFVEFHTRAEVKGSLGSVPMVLSCYVHPSTSLLVFSYSSVSSVHSSASTSTALTYAQPLFNYRPNCSHNIHYTCATRHRSASRHISSIRRVVIYWEMVLWRRRTYVSISSRSYVNIVTASGSYYQFHSISCCGFIPANRREK